MPDPDGPLRSDLLSVDKRLQRCAQFDGSHVQPEEPPAEHVRLIQEALRQVDNANIPSGEKNYGKFTREAVVAFKTKKNLFTRGTRTIDPIVGTGTIAALDLGMQQIEARKKPPAPTPKVVPRLALSGQCQIIGERKDNPLADDMKTGDGFAARKSGTTTAITAPFMLMDDFTLENAMLTAMGLAVNIAGGTTASANIRAQALLLCQQFFIGGGVQKDFRKGNEVSNAAQTDDGFKAFVFNVQKTVEREVRRAWKAGLVDDRAIAATLRTEMDSPKFGTGKFSGALTAFIGGFQGYHLEMCGLTADTTAQTFTYKLDVEIFDHFGVDDSDINRQSGAAGGAIGTAMASFFVLQHDRNQGGLNLRFKKYHPFRLTLRTDMGPFTGAVF